MCAMPTQNGIDLERVEWMEAKESNGTPGGFVRATDVHQAIDELRRSLTVIYAQAQLMQRRNRLGTPPTSAQLETSANAIALAAVTMNHDIQKLEERCIAE